MELRFGDALGDTTEFMTPDTAMTIALAKGIIANPKDPIPAIGEEFMKWFQTKPKDVGRSVSLALEQYLQCNDWGIVAKKAHELGNGRSAGNGTLMRTLPVALAYPDLRTIEKITVRQSKLTHFDSLASEASVIYNRIAHRILTSGIDLIQAIQFEVIGIRYEPVLKEKSEVPPNGYVVYTFLWVLYLLLQYSTVEEVIIEAANMGDDSDTVAAIAGGLMGLYQGYDSIPKQFTEMILLKSKLNDLANQLYEIRNSMQMGNE
ncbi:ADP-ribosylglycohydrolase family protein [Tepidibacillus marianensis]|uniref:ADP-ribosylglycohydrolase family protein n=1 Tax=Tepidibacillus marianensis TaxID=3131995 RepID=UPI0030CFB1BD